MLEQTMQRTPQVEMPKFNVAETANRAKEQAKQWGKEALHKFDKLKEKIAGKPRVVIEAVAKATDDKSLVVNERSKSSADDAADVIKTPPPQDGDKREIEDKNSTTVLDDEALLKEIPFFKAGNDKQFRKIVYDGKAIVVAEYRKPVSQDFIDATVAQQRILHTLFPNRFVVDISESRIGTDGIARIAMGLVDNIDQGRSPKTSGGNVDYTAVADYIAEIKETPEFQRLLPELRRIGLVPSSELQTEMNELAGNTLFDTNGKQIIVDIMNPTVIRSGDEKALPVQRLDVEGVRELAEEKGVDKQLSEIIKTYKDATTKLCGEVEASENLSSTGEQFLRLVEKQLNGEYLPYSQNPSVIVFETESPVAAGFRKMEKDQADNMAQIKAGPELGEGNERGIQLLHRKDGTWRLTDFYTGESDHIESGAIDSSWDEKNDQFAIAYHSHGNHPQVVRFFSPEDLGPTLIMRNPENVNSLPRVECVVTPGINFMVMATEETPKLSLMEVDIKVGHHELNTDVVWPNEFKTLNERLLEIGGSDTHSNLMHRDTLPKEPTPNDEKIFDPQLSAYGVELSNYIYVLSLAQKYNLAVYCAKTGNNKFIRIDEQFNPGDKL